MGLPCPLIVAHVPSSLAGSPTWPVHATSFTAALKAGSDSTTFGACL